MFRGISSVIIAFSLLDGIKVQLPENMISDTVNARKGINNDKNISISLCFDQSALNLPAYLFKTHKSGGISCNASKGSLS